MASRAFVLAAGFGTRLQPLTLTTPKPLVPVCGVPMLAWSLALLKHHGIDSAVVNTHYLADAFLPWRGYHEGVDVTLSHETPNILGTGGGIQSVADQLTDPFVIVNADILCDIDLAELLAITPFAGAAMALRQPDEGQDYGVVAADSQSVVSRLVTLACAEPCGALDESTHFTGVHAMSQAALSLVPSGFQCVVRTAYTTMVPKRVVKATRHTGVWLDVGNPKAYLLANLAVLEGRGPSHLNPMERAGWSRDHCGGERGDPRLVAGVTVTGPCWVGVGANIAQGTTIHRSVIGANSVVEAGAVVHDCVVWDGEIVGAGHHHSQIFHSGEQTTIS